MIISLFFVTSNSQGSTTDLTPTTTIKAPTSEELGSWNVYCGNASGCDPTAPIKTAVREQEFIFHPSNEQDNDPCIIGFQGIDWEDLGNITKVAVQFYWYSYGDSTFKVEFNVFGSWISVVENYDPPNPTPAEAVWEEKEFDITGEISWTESLLDSFKLRIYKSTGFDNAIGIDDIQLKVTSLKASVEGTTTYTEGFENGLPSDWNYATPSLWTTTTEKVHDGSHSLKLSGSGGVEFEGIQLPYNSQNGSIEAWVYTTSNFDEPMLYLRTSANENPPSGCNLTIKSGYGIRLYLQNATFFRITNHTLHYLPSIDLNEYIYHKWWHMKLEADGSLLKAWVTKSSTFDPQPNITYDISNDPIQYHSGKLALSGRATSIGSGYPGYFDSITVKVTEENNEVLYYQEYGPILIDSNNDFETLGFPGSGTMNDPYVIKRLNITDTTTDLIFIRDTTVYFTIRDCLLNSTYGTMYNGIFLERVQYGTIVNNTILNCNHGVRIDSSSENTVSNNSISNHKLSGIRTDFCHHLTIANNSISHNNQGGIDLTASNDNTISNNTISHHEGNNGIHLLNSSRNNIMKNDISNGTHGIHLHYDTNAENIIVGNIFSYHSGGWAVNLDSIASNTLVKWNDFLENTNQAKDDGTNNVFEYNYWDDWTTPDNDGDGIVDNSYSIQGIANNQDLYPLTSPDTQPFSTSTTDTTSTGTSVETVPTTTDTSVGIIPTITPFNPLSLLVGLGIAVIIRLKIRKKKYS